MNRIIFSLLYILPCCYVFSLAFVFEDCGSDGASASDIAISNCPDTSVDRCVLKRGSEESLSFKFTPKRDIATMRTNGTGVMAGIELPLPLTEEERDTCIHLTPTCPLKSGQEAEYKISFFIEKNIPPVNVDLSFHFENENKEKLFCLKFPLSIK